MPLTRVERRKVNLNQGHLNCRESKQERSRIVARHARAACDRQCTNERANDEPNKQGGDKNDQSRQPNANHLLLSVKAANSCIVKDDKRKRPAGNDARPTSKHSLNDTRSSANTMKAGKNLPDSEEQQQQQQQQQQQSQPNSNCYNHEGAKSTLTKSPAIYFNQAGSNLTNSEQHLINDRIIPKPMGHQVLSLMMLDVGLMPATNSQCQPNPSQKRSHVRLSSQPSIDFYSTESNRLDPYLLNSVDENDSRSVHDKNFGERFIKSNDNAGPQSDKVLGVHRAPFTNEALGLQVHLPTHGFKSISLPCSPRNDVRGQPNKHRPVLGRPGNLNEGNCPSANYRAAHPFADEIFRERYRPDCPTGNDELERSCLGQQLEHDGLISACDTNQRDSHSVSSSSSSSLNQCPPFLSLSNQLLELKVQRLVKADVGLDAAALKKHRQNGQDCATDGGSLSPSNQLARVARQHELLTSDLNAETKQQCPRKDQHLFLSKSNQSWTNDQSFVSFENDGLDRKNPIESAQDWNHPRSSAPGKQTDTSSECFPSPQLRLVFRASSIHHVRCVSNHRILTGPYNCLASLLGV